jgi:hypothetical protein
MAELFLYFTIHLHSMVLNKHRDNFNFFHLWLYSPIRALAASMKLSVSLQLLDLGQSVGHLGRVISSSQGLYLYTNTEKTHTTQTQNIHAPTGIRNHGPGFHASEDSSCLRPLGYRDRPPLIYL